ncbi:hypothetical protein [Agromyces sp. H66]|uniref:hypothetical protein n=1 Tax=Agromyces sp. H66 TaxID=2529859 RepID=UPI0010A9972A|nr:hypothetical protein [Agromyces sp. H66]
MRERSVKIDPSTGRLIADLAHFLGRTKKSVLHDAVLAFTEVHENTITRGAAESTERAAGTSGSLEGARLLAAAAGDVMTLPLRDRVTVLRRRLLEVLRRHDARNPRMVGDLAKGIDTDILELLVERDLFSDRWNLLECIHEAQLLLGATVHLHDSTALGLIASDRLERLEREAVPL